MCVKSLYKIKWRSRKYEVLYIETFAPESKVNRVQHTEWNPKEDPRNL
jgi:hypothetical protein